MDGHVLLVIMLVCVWLFPISIAGLRGHPNTAAIAALDILLGWTFVGWAVALVWSLTAIERPAPPRQ